MEELVPLIGVFVVTCVVLGLPIACTLSFVYNWHVVIKLFIIAATALDFIWVMGTVFEIVDEDFKN